MPHFVPYFCNGKVKGEGAVLTIAEAARIARVDPSTMHRWIKKGIISTVKDGSGRRGIDPAELDRVVKSGAIADPVTSKPVPQDTMVSIASIAEQLASSKLLQTQLDAIARDLEQARQELEEYRRREREAQDREKWLQARIEAMEVKLLLPPPQSSFIKRVMAKFRR
jgi:DNA-binding transcriptional MerR regulator